jgi:hypothetical protein
VSSPRKASSDLLQHPAVAVGIAERRPGTIATSLGVGPRDATGGACVVEDSAGIVEDLAHVDTVFDEFGAGRLDVGHHQHSSLMGASRFGGDAATENDRARRARRRQLDDAKIVSADNVGIKPPIQSLVEVLGPINTSFISTVGFSLPRHPGIASDAATFKSGCRCF